MRYEPGDEQGGGHVRASEARQGFADLLNRAAEGGERIRVERHGRPVAAIVPIADLELLEALDSGRGGQTQKERAPLDRGARAVAQLERARGHVAMSTDQIMALTRDS